MKKIYISVRKLFAAGAAALAGWLGISGCSNATDDYPVEYGTPTVRYSFKVKVEDRTDAPVEGLQVGLKDEYGSEELTDKSGTALLEGDLIGGYREFEVTFVVKDVDGAANGTVSDLTHTETITTDDFTDRGDGHWINGTVKKEINLKVDRK